MAKQIIIIISLLCSSITTFAQKHLDISYMECSYMLTYMEDTVAKRKTVKDSDMRLLIGEKHSKFYSHTTFLRDSVRASMSSTEQANSIGNFNKYPLGESYEIYKNYVESIITITDLIPTSGHVLCNEVLQKQDWKILNETKQIAGYKCQKATCRFRGRDYVAWFTREIPVSEGPHKFSGLPGLIVKIHDTKEHYDFELYSVRRIKKPIIFNEFGSFYNRQYQEVSIKDYIRLKKNYNANPFAGQQVTFRRADGTEFTPQRLYDVMERDVK